jgi:hypothetical protein
MKHSVYVPEYPGKPVFEKYHGIPAKYFFRRIAQAARNFCRKHVHCCELGVTDIVCLEHGICINGVCIAPTKFGQDGDCEVWFFDEITLQGMNLTCGKNE